MFLTNSNKAYRALLTKYPSNRVIWLVGELRRLMDDLPNLDLSEVVVILEDNHYKILENQDYCIRVGLRYLIVNKQDDSQYIMECIEKTRNSIY